MKKAVLLALLTLSACSNTQPVHGSIGDGKEKFLGTATGYMSGNGELKIKTIDGIQCTGKFNHGAQMALVGGTGTGTGSFICDDRRTGKFDYTSDGMSGQGFGKTSAGEPFSFTFGQPEKTQSAW